MSEILDVFGIDWKLLLVQAFNFGILILILWYLLYRPVVSMLEKRQATIAEGVHNAEKAAQELSDIARQKELILTDANKDAGIIIDRAKERALSKEEAILTEAQARSERIQKEAEQKALEEKRRALVAAQEEISRMIVLGAEKVLRESHK